MAYAGHEMQRECPAYVPSASNALCLECPAYVPSAYVHTQEEKGRERKRVCAREREKKRNTQGAKCSLG